MTHNHSPRPSTMKCIKRKVDGDIQRVRNSEAAAKVATGDHNYTTKGAYRAQERNHVPV